MEDGFLECSGQGGKYKGFWLGLEDWDVIILVETWMEDRGWGKIRERLPRGFEWGGADGEKRGEERKGDEGNVNGNKEGIVERRI